jgi:hypothetical protein
MCRSSPPIPHLMNSGTTRLQPSWHDLQVRAPVANWETACYRMAWSPAGCRLLVQVKLVFSVVGFPVKSASRRVHRSGAAGRLASADEGIRHADDSLREHGQVKIALLPTQLMRVLLAFGICDRICQSRLPYGMMWELSPACMMVCVYLSLWTSGC